MRTMSLKSESRRRALGIASIFVALAVGVAGCGGDPADPKTTVEADVNAEKTPPPEPKLPAAWPLTGVAGTVEMRPALTIKVENSAASRPQTGLEDADMVWEELVEGGITRFAAMYHSKLPEKVGPIRSIRPMDAGIAGATNGIIAFSGGIDIFVKAAKDAGLQILSQDGGSKGFARDKSRKAPHNVFGSPEDFIAQADETHASPPPAVLTHARDAATASAVSTGAPAKSLSLAFSTAVKPSWDWDETDNTWKRSENGKDFLTAAGPQVEAVNVVILRVEIVNSGSFDPAGSPVPETKIVGSGKAIVATGGKYVTGTWTKSDVGAPITINGANGETLNLAPGSTWVELVPTSMGEDGAVVE